VPLVPDVADLTSQLGEYIATTELADAFAMIASQLREDGALSPNIEAILTHIRSLRQAAGSQEARGLSAAQLQQLDDELCNKIVQIADQKLPSCDTPYHHLAVWTVSAARDFPVQFFTANYDLLLEQALEDRRAPYFDGFVGSRQAFFDPYAMEEDRLPSRWSRVWKLHGSINWMLDDSGNVYRASEPKPGAARVIHPSHLKYEESRRMPYLAMVDRLRAFFTQAKPPLLVTCGYSFRDQHINESLQQGLRGNPKAMAFCLVYGKIECYPLALQLALTRPNLSLLAEDAAVVGTRQAVWADRSESSSSPASNAREAPGNQGDSTGGRGLFPLGDFREFALFIRELVGRKGMPGRAANGS